MRRLHIREFQEFEIKSLYFETQEVTVIASTDSDGIHVSLILVAGP